MSRLTGAARGELPAELAFVEDSLYYVSNQLARVKASDPLADELAEIAVHVAAARKVLEARAKKK